MEFEEIQRRIEEKSHGHLTNNSKSEDQQWFLGFGENGGNVFLKDVIVVVEDIDMRMLSLV